MAVLIVVGIVMGLSTPSVIGIWRALAHLMLLMLPLFIRLCALGGLSITLNGRPK